MSGRAGSWSGRSQLARSSMRHVPMGGQERRQVARDGRVRRVGQAELLKARPPAGRPVVQADAGKKASTSTLADLLAGDFQLQAAADQPRPAPGRLTVSRSGASWPSSVSLTCWQVRDQHGPLPRLELAVAGQPSLRGDGPGPGRDCRRRGSGARRRPRGGTAPCRPVSPRTRISVKSDVPPPMSQTRIFWPGATCRSQSRRMRVDPGVKRRLGLLDQHDPRQPGPGGRLDGQLAGDLVERGRQREHDILLGQRMLGKRASQASRMWAR